MVLADTPSHPVELEPDDPLDDLVAQGEVGDEAQAAEQGGGTGILYDPVRPCPWSGRCAQTPSYAERATDSGTVVSETTMCAPASARVYSSSSRKPGNDTFWGARPRVVVGPVDGSGSLSALTDIVRTGDAG